MYKINDGTSDSAPVSVAIAVGGALGARTNLEEFPRMAGGAGPATRWDVRSVGRLQATGGLELALPLTAQASGSAIPTLIYRSDSLPKPIVIIETYLQSSSGSPDAITAQLTFNGVAGTTYSFDTTGLVAGQSLRFALQADATGRYAYSVTLVTRFAGG